MGNQEIEHKQYLINHPILKNSLIQVDRGQIKTYVSVLDQADLGDWIQNIQRIKNFQSDFFFNPQRYSIQNRSMCGNSCLIKLTFSMHPYVLMDQILNRRHIKRHFEQNELWYILFALADCSNNFLDVEDSVGDIRPHNIMFNEIGELKVMHRFSWPGELSNFQKTKFENIVTYLSPQQVNLLCAGKTYNSLDKIQSQSFSIGLTLLSAVYLYDFSELYDATFMNLDLQELRNYIERVEQRTYVDQHSGKTMNYSSQIIKIIQRLCDPDNYSRLSIIDVYRWLLPYQKQIIDFQPFRLKIFDNQNAKQSLSYKNEVQSVASGAVSELIRKEPSQLKITTQKMMNDVKMNRRASRSNTLNVVPIQMQDLSSAAEQPKHNLSPVIKIPPSHGTNILHNSNQHRTFSQNVQLSIPKLQKQKYSANSVFETPNMSHDSSKIRQPENKFYVNSPQSENKQGNSIKIEDLQIQKRPKLKQPVVPIVPTPKSRKQILADMNIVSTYSKYPEDDHLLKKIEQQLMRSRNMFPS